MEDYIRVAYIDMPYSSKCFTVNTNDGYFTIYLNSRLSAEQNRLSYYHELAHIINGDFEKSNHCNLIEFFAHK